MKKLVFTLTLLTVTVLGSICAYAGSWQKDHIGWWYKLSGGGYYANTWYQDSDGKWYYFNQNGYMVANQWVGDYYLGEDGAMATNQMIQGGYWVGSDGKWEPSTNNTSNNLSGLTGKFYFSGAYMDVSEDGDGSLHIKGNLNRQSDDVNLGYTEDWIEVTDDSVLYTLSSAGERSYLTKKSFKDLVQHLADPEIIWMEVYNGKIISAYIGAYGD